MSNAEHHQALLSGPDEPSAPIEFFDLDDFVELCE